MAFTRNWDDSVTTGQTLYGTGTPSQSVVSGRLRIACASAGFNTINFSTVTAVANFDATMTMYWLNTGDVGFLYRTTYWASVDGTQGYMVRLIGTGLDMYRGTNSASVSWTLVKSYTFTPVSGTGYVVRVRVIGNYHEVWLDGVMRLNTYEASLPSAGQFGFRGYQASAGYQEWDNLQIDDVDALTWANRGTITLASRTMDYASTEVTNRTTKGDYTKPLAYTKLISTPPTIVPVVTKDIVTPSYRDQSITTKAAHKQISYQRILFTPSSFSIKATFFVKQLTATWTRAATSTFVDTTGYVSGTVKIDNVVIPNATVRIYYKPNGTFIAEQKTDSNGYFRFLYLEVGMPYYTVMVYNAGYNAMVLDGIKPKKVIP